jgi:hypothetical protein
MASPNPIGSLAPYPMLENVIEDIKRVSQELRLPTGTTIGI